VRVFLTHGGSNGFHEGIYFGKPLLVLLRNVKPARLTDPTTAKLSAMATNPTFTPTITGNLTVVVQQRKSSEPIKPAAIPEADGRRSKNVSKTPGKNCAAPLVATRSMLTNVLLAVAQLTKANRIAHRTSASLAKLTQATPRSPLKKTRKQK